MIEINEILNDEGEFNKGILVSPNWIKNGKTDNEWTLHTTETLLKELKRIKRMKGRKSYSILLDFGGHLSDWIEVTYPILMSMVRNRDSKFANCTYNQLWYIRVHTSFGNHRRVSIWPAFVRNDNENSDNNWGEEE